MDGLKDVGASAAVLNHGIIPSAAGSGSRGNEGGLPPVAEAEQRERERGGEGGDGQRDELGE